MNKKKRQTIQCIIVHQFVAIVMLWDTTTPTTSKAPVPVPLHAWLSSVSSQVVIDAANIPRHPPAVPLLQFGRHGLD